MGGGRGSLRKRRNLQPGNPFVGQAARQWGKVWQDLDMESPQADGPASFKMSSSAWKCLRLSPVGRAGVYPYTA